VEERRRFTVVRELLRQISLRFMSNSPAVGPRQQRKNIPLCLVDGIPDSLDGVPDSLDGVIPSKATVIATGTTTVAYRAGQDDGQWGDEGGGGDGGGVMDTSGDEGLVVCSRR
jgi:hypothetical protein